MSNTHLIDRIKASVTVHDVLARFGAPSLKRTAKGHAGSCPICSTHKKKRSRAFTVSADGQAWYCFGDCRRGGSVIDLAMALHNCSATEAMQRLCANAVTAKSS